MQLFYVTNIQNDLAFFEEEEARHCVQVLRKKVGDPIQFVDGKGNWYTSNIIETGKKKCIVQIQEQKSNFEKRPYHLHVGIAPTKNISRFEWFLEKATEIGIDEITPIICEHSERRRIRNDRLEKIILSAMKQSLKAFLPKLNELCSFKDFVAKGNHNNQSFIAHCEEGAKVPLKREESLDSNYTLLIGPEGDFSPEEIQLANEHGFRSLTLGKSRLRTETAGVIACAQINFIHC